MNCRSAWTARVAVGALCAMTAAASVSAAELSALPGLSQGRAGNPACAVLTVDEVRTLTGFPGYNQPSPGDPPGEGVGGGASCQYEAPLFAVDANGKGIAAPKGPLLSIVLITGKNYTQTKAIGKGCNKESAAGVGDVAFFEVCPATKVSRTSPLYVKKGATDLVLQLDINAPDTDASLRPKLIALARAAAAKVK
jgi:hypothetical protein